MSNPRGNVLVTGAGSGIGRETCHALAERGYFVLANDINASAAAEVAQQVGGTAISGDLAGDCDEIANRVSDEVDALAGLVNNAAVQRKVPLSKISVADMDPLYAVNLRAPVLLSSRLLPLLERGRGAIVNIASMSGIHPQPGAGLYTATKAALIAFTEQASVEWAESGVRVNAICPGLVRTPMSESVYADEARHEARRTFVPMRRIGTMREMADAVCFLLSPQAAYVNGVALKVDGGVCNALMTAFP
jgi:glucose 1-dehydrogenase